MCRAITETYLDTSEAQNASLLALEPLVDLVRVVAVHVRLLHQRERHAVVALAERRDLVVGAGLLPAELAHTQDSAGAGRWTRRAHLVAREAEDDKVLVLVLVVELL